MPWTPKGQDNLRYWGCTAVPEVGTTDIDARNMVRVATQGVTSLAVITAIKRAGNLDAACQ